MFIHWRYGFWLHLWYVRTLGRTACKNWFLNRTRKISTFLIFNTEKVVVRNKSLLTFNTGKAVVRNKVLWRAHTLIFFTYRLNINVFTLWWKETCFSNGRWTLNIRVVKFVTCKVIVCQLYNGQTKFPPKQRKIRSKIDNPSKHIHDRPPSWPRTDTSIHIWPATLLT
jgi:hypothetical protein